MGPYRGVKPVEAGSHFPASIYSLATGEGASASPARSPPRRESRSNSSIGRIRVRACSRAPLRLDPLLALSLIHI